MISAILFDFGGTLDGDGLHWLDRFYSIYEGSGLGDVDRARLKEAFYEADRCLEADPTIGGCGFREMMLRHARCQVHRLGLEGRASIEQLADGFAGPARAALDRNRSTLAALRAEGYRLGVVSNFYGNVAALCDEAGLGPLLDVVLDSAVVGLRKPDPRLYTEALTRLGVAAADAAMVGDSFDRDVRPARSLGMHAYWLAPGRAAQCPDVSLVDGILETLADLPGRLAGCRRCA
jgi:putative hydrolase of the HAD superfamily